MNNSSPIHAVVTWVDGSDLGHVNSLARHQAQVEKHRPLSENASNPHRWADNDELSYCLRSIHNNAPWIETIWIVTNGQKPDLNGLPDGLLAKVKSAFHDQIFSGFADCLPTFNSLAIESALWRIDGLAERFIYFNDDVFLTAPTSPEDFFSNDMPVLRGGWRDFSHLTSTSEQFEDPAFFNHYVQINAAAIAGFKSNRLFETAHVAHPMLRSVFATLFEDHAEAFVKNMGYRFRDISQFLPQGLHNHACISANRATFAATKDHFHVYSFYGAGSSEVDVRCALDKGLVNAKFLCVNDLPELAKIVPNIRDWLEIAIAK